MRKRLIASSFVLVAGLALAGMAAAGNKSSKTTGDIVIPPSRTTYEIKQGFEIAPVPLNMEGLDKDLVGLGSYIVNAQGGCNDCHTCPNFAPGGDPYAGEPIKINPDNYLAGGVAFGPFVSRNLTPVNGLPANKTLDEFIQILRTGEDPGNGGQLLQVMPWPVYGRMTQLDLTAVYTYLQAIPPASPGTVCGAPPPAAARAQH